MWFQIALRNLSRNRRRTLLTLGVIALGTAMSFAVAGYIDDALHNLQSETVRQFGNFQIANPTLWEDKLTGYQAMITPETYAKLNEILSGYPEITANTPEILVSGIASTGSTSKALRVIAFQPENEALDYNDIVVVKNPDAPVAVPSSSANGVLIGESLAKEFDIQLGQRLVFYSSTVNGQHNSTRLRVEGIYQRNDQRDESQLVFVPIAAAQNLLVTDSYSKVAVMIDALNDTDRVAAAIQHDIDGAVLCGSYTANLYVGNPQSASTEIAPGSTITPENQAAAISIGQHSGRENLDAVSIRVTEQPANGTVQTDHETGDVVYTPYAGFIGNDSFQYDACNVAGLGLQVRTWKQLSVYYQQVEGFFNALFAFLTFAVAVLVFFIVFQVLTMSFLERTREVGTIRAIGTKRQQVFSMFILESLLLGAVGGLLGLGVGWLLGQGFNSLEIGWMAPGAIRPTPVELALTLGNAWLPLVISTAATLLSALLPSIYSARIQIVDALRTS